MSIAPELLDILACPRDKGPLEYHAQENVLVNPRLNVAYPIRDDIPVLLVDEARPYEALAEGSTEDSSDSV